MFSICFFLAVLPTARGIVDLGDCSLSVEIADTAETRERGLMFRDHLPSGHGMLFVYDSPKILSFWMKNTKIPLSIALFDENKQLIDLFDMYPPSEDTKEPPIYSSVRPALYAIEVPIHWFEDHGIKKGMKFSFPNHSNALN